MSRTRNRRVKRSVVVALTSVLTVGCIVAIVLGGIQGVGNTGPMIKGTVKWFNDAYLNAVNALLCGTGLTIDRYEGPRLDTIGIRIEPPLGVRVTDNNSPPRGVAKKIIGSFVVLIDLLPTGGGEPWANLAASNAGAVASIPYDWGISLFSLPPGGLPVIFGDKTYLIQETADSGVSGLSMEDTAASAPSGEHPGVLNRRQHDHIGNFDSISIADRLLGGGGQQAIKKIVGVSIDADVGILPDGQSIILLGIEVQPPRETPDPAAHGLARCQPPYPQEILVDLVGQANGEPIITMALASGHGRPDRIIVWPSLPAGGLAVHYGGQTYILTATADGGLTLTAD